MFAWQKFVIKPDLMTCAKGLGCGVPVGAFLLMEKAAQNSLVAGDHCTTYGENPLACAAINNVLDQYEKLHFVDQVNEVAPYLVSEFDRLADTYDCTKLRREEISWRASSLTDRPERSLIMRWIRASF